MPETNDCAVTMGCDSNYLPYALHLAWQIAVKAPRRRFDILILTLVPLPLPDWAEAMGIRNVAMPLRPPWAACDPQQFGPALYLYLSAIPDLAGRYRRILKLDSDIWYEAGDLDRLLHADIGSHPLAAVRDVIALYRERRGHATEFKDRGLPAFRYLNAGVQIIDTAAWVTQEMERRLLDTHAAEGAKLLLADQTLLNLTLRGRFAELAPCWNWMSNSRLNLATFRYAPRFRHFCGINKPWRDPHGMLEARFRDGYADFFRTFLPEALPRLEDPTTALWGLRDATRAVIDYAKGRDLIRLALARFRDEWTVRT